ncbi:MAG TPA: tetratricopeptide repeat protein [Stellaceae bacterium]|nr:tetratricopeptide repeat protein [Stellaceae bacterium]
MAGVSEALASWAVEAEDEGVLGQCRSAEALYYDGRYDEALALARTAFAAAGESEAVADFCGWLFSNCGRHGEAAAAYEALLRCRPGWAAGHRHASGSYAAIGETERALFHALRAYALRPADCGIACHATELLLRSDRLEEAAEIARRTANGHPGNEVAFRLLSEAEMRLGDEAGALAAIDRALALAGGKVEYQLHRGHLLCRLGRWDEAIESFGEALSIEPANVAAQRALLSALLDSGRVEEALAYGGALIHAAPDSEEIGQALLETLNRRFATLDGDYIVLGERRLKPLRPPRPLPRWSDGLGTQARVVLALVIREARTRFAEAKLGYGWALLEPILHILMLSLVFAVLMRGQPPIGREFFIFYYTGIIPYHMFVHTSSNLAYAISGSAALLQLPLVTTLDLVIARGLVEFVTDALVAVILLVGLSAFGLHARPHDLFGIGAALIASWLLGCGCGIVNAVVNRFVKSWDKIWVQLARVLYFTSGIFYVPAMMPDRIRDILVWNPVLQAVEWFRSSFFEGYDPHWLDRSYLAGLALLAVLLGLGLERRLRPRLFEPS